MLEPNPATYSLPPGTIVVPAIVPETEDPAALMRREGVRLIWKGYGPVTKFIERPLPHVIDQNITLPTLYLHRLGQQFIPLEDSVNTSLRHGNDNAEICLVLPLSVLDNIDKLPGNMTNIAENLRTVMNFVKEQGEPEISNFTYCVRPESRHYDAEVDTGRIIYRFTTSRPKADITLDKGLFGIPEDAQLYLYVQHHASHQYIPREVKEAFDACLQDLCELPEGPTSLRPLSTFLKIFFEGGFGYNKKISTSSSSYLPKCVGIAAMGTVPAFEGQVGISTGYPYRFGYQFLPYMDTVPVSIDAISSMSVQHGRYGLCFTRCLFIWDDGSLRSSGSLNFCSPAPHGGFFYVPMDYQKYKEIGGLIYAFGESKDIPEGEGSTQS